MNTFAMAAAALGLSLLGGSALAESHTIIFDEGGGLSDTFSGLTSASRTDIFPEGTISPVTGLSLSPTVVTYWDPRFQVVPGDVILKDAKGGRSDIIQFYNTTAPQFGYGAVAAAAFYSKGDQVGWPTLGADRVKATEVTLSGYAVKLDGFTKGSQGYTYTPLIGQPGYSETAGTTLSYQFISQGNSPTGVPEPAAWALLLAGVAMSGAALRRNRMMTAAA